MQAAIISHIPAADTTGHMRLGIENIFEKAYQDHPGGYNRVGGCDIPLRERLYSMGRNYYIKLNATW